MAAVLKGNLSITNTVSALFLRSSCPCLPKIACSHHHRSSANVGKLRKARTLQQTLYVDKFCTRTPLWQFGEVVRDFCTFCKLQTPRRRVEPKSDAWSSSSGRSSADLQIGKLRRALQAEFSARNIPEPRESAELLIAGVIGKPTLSGVKSEHILSQDQYKELRDMCYQRMQRKPVQYILGEWDFCGMCLEMREPVFIPRPETEDLVNYITRHLRESCPEQPIRMLEIGCGSGAITLALLKHFLQMEAVAVDQLPEACKLTMDNGDRVGVTDRVTVLHLDIAKNPRERWPPALSAGFDLVVSNPPYICTVEVPTLAPEIIRFEDMAALDGGTDGLDLVKVILGEAASLLKPQGQVWLEVGLSQPDLVARLVASHPQWRLRYLSSWPDCTQRMRFCQLGLLDG